jgi:hypothetical protein
MTFKAYSVSTEHRGRTYHASYVLQDNEVCVMSAYGSKSAPLAERDAKTLATELLDEIVRRRQ